MTIGILPQMGTESLFETIVRKAVHTTLPVDLHENSGPSSSISPMRPSRPHLFLSQLEREGNLHFSLQRNLFPLEELSRDQTEPAIFSQVCFQ
jgi:hypothetical protein